MNESVSFFILIEGGRETRWDPDETNARGRNRGLSGREKM